ncbi:MAG: hypothetical protein QOH01_2348 [Verrucomicrobiota bacterium]|jgi:2-polyprenyl-6-hydroxyphenyl methylase/3-demethylubiquinone-9 3-methyltransferase
MTDVQFNFGENWREFSANALTAERVAEAKRDFVDLLRGIELKERSFLDIGFGQGLSLLTATALGARTVGCDINPLCAEVLRENRARAFPGDIDGEVPVIVGSILDAQLVDALREAAPGGSGSYDIVHSWGVLHHTGNMAAALRNAASLVHPRGHLIIAIYNRHWSSRAWWLIKRAYQFLPKFGQRLMVGGLWPVIFVAKWLSTGGNPLRQSRGMDFHYDVVDWVGGYPYEYGSVHEIARFVEALGFRLERTIPARVPTGCNQFVFERVATAAAAIPKVES